MNSLSLFSLQIFLQGLDLHSTSHLPRPPKIRFEVALSTSHRKIEGIDIPASVVLTIAIVGNTPHHQYLFKLVYRVIEKYAQNNECLFLKPLPTMGTSNTMECHRKDRPDKRPRLDAPHHYGRTHTRSIIAERVAHQKQLELFA